MLARSRIKIRYQNGIDRQIAERDIFQELVSEFEFIESTEPDYILFGPYGNDVPPPGNYVRIGYFCENFKPDMSICEWAFGIPREEDVNNSHYKRIQWHGINPSKLVKAADYNAEKIADSKRYFCNFLYSHSVHYREEFFRQLSRYKKVDAPGKSMNNMQNIDRLHSGDKWECKKQFISEYKFTIAFENYIYPGYQTEKLYDAMQANSLPIYCGDPFIGKIFNTSSFINTSDYINTNPSAAVNWIEKFAQPDFEDMRPSFYNNPLQRIKRKLKAVGAQIKMRYQFRNWILPH